MVKAWNKTVVQALVTGIAREEIITVKKGTPAPLKVAEPKEEKPAIPPRPKVPASLLKWNQML